MTYRLDFWVEFIAPTFVQLGVSYFLWRAVFEARGLTELGGFTLPALMLYYFFVFMAGRIVSGGEWRMLISEEIYDGSLSRYLVYPTSFFGIKTVQEWATALLHSLQLLLALGVYLAFFKMPLGVGLSLSSLAMGFVAAFVAAQLSIVLAILLEMFAFWAENVWNLKTILRFLTNFFGGALIPLSLFPDVFTRYMKFNPFACLMYFPVQSFLGKLPFREWLSFLGLTVLWIGLFAALGYGMWKKGLRQYAGTGM